MVVALTTAIFLSFYFTYLSLVSSDEALKKQLVFLAATTIVTAAVLVACLLIFLSFRQFFRRFAEARSRS